MIIKSQEVTIRNFEEKDIENKVSWINNNENNKYLHYDIPLTYDKTLQWFKNKNNEIRMDLVIEYNNIPVGLIGLLNIDKINSKAEFYISMGEVNYKRKGIASTASKLLIDYSFNHLKLNKIYLNVDSENIAACNLYEKLGFKCEGIFLKDMMHNDRLIDRKRYAIFNGDLK